MIPTDWDSRRKPVQRCTRLSKILDSAAVDEHEEERDAAQKLNGYDASRLEDPDYKISQVLAWPAFPTGSVLELLDRCVFCFLGGFVQLK